ncbi:uncharacterized protein BDZ99DRAFT_481332 [Mytilinidion resinicola]|uniref:Uncharacterized protein n=1 Tax=Mytilinidion resinicola TaxID=574789 RepID=A0A6A6Y7J5_9PEZI|nr:uncharacterized protein BDZ99DRAFT_481332 [Mytilinidion resinicola]KAF2804155.1 hypothetical protein BDZ99DRAFT_481332 [Mytilinidion resinicola]
MATHSTITGPFRLLDLPAELRNKIYYWALPVEVTPYVCQHNAVHHATCSDCNTATDLPAPNPAANLLATCRQIHDEALPILRKYTTLYLPVQPWCPIPLVLWPALYFRNILIAPVNNCEPLDVAALAALFDGVLTRMRVRRSYAQVQRIAVQLYAFEAFGQMMGAMRWEKAVAGFQDITKAWPYLPVKLEFVVLAVRKEATVWEKSEKGVELRKKCAEGGMGLEVRERAAKTVEVLVGKWCVCSAEAYCMDVKRRFREAPGSVPWREIVRMNEFEKKNREKMEELERRG